MSEYVRDRATALRRATPGQAPIPVYRPAASRFLIAGLCAWILIQPLTSSGGPSPYPESATPALEVHAEVSDAATR